MSSEPASRSLGESRGPRWYQFGVLSLMIAVTAACFAAAAYAWFARRGPEQLTLYSIDFRDMEDKKWGRPAKVAASDETFHGYPVIGKIEIARLSDRVEILAAIKDGMARSDGERAKCFWPRHGVSVVENGKATDYIICFQCLQLRIYEDGNVYSEAVTRDPSAVLDQHLADAGVRLVP